MLAADDPRVTALTSCVQSGDLAQLELLLREHPALVSQRFGDRHMSRTATHVATDWPGHFPNVAATLAVLVNAGADVDGRFAGPHTETALHWAASADDVEAIDALLTLGADIEADGAVLTGGTPLADAVVFAQWGAARLLVGRGATMTIWQAAALGESKRVEQLVSGGAPTADDITNACWHACRAGQLGTARLLVDHGADLGWLGYDDLTCRQAGLASGQPDLIAWLADQ